MIDLEPTRGHSRSSRIKQTPAIKNTLYAWKEIKRKQEAREERERENKQVARSKNNDKTQHKQEIKSRIRASSV